MLKALIVDDEELARRGLQIRLQKFDDVEVCGECRNGREAIDAVREHSPDIVFLDVQMPGINGFDVLKLSLIHISEPTRLLRRSRMPSSA